MRSDAEIRKGVLLGTVSSYVGKAASMATWFVLTPFMLQELGPLEFGLWALVGSLGAYGSLLDLGVAAAVAKFLAQYEATGRRDRSNAVLGTAGVLYSVLAVVVAVIAWFAAGPVVSLLGVASDTRGTAVDLVRVTGLSVAMGFITTPPAAALRGLHRFDLAALSATMGSLLAAGATVLVLLGGADVVGVVVVGIPLAATMHLVNLRLVRGVAPGLRFGLRRAEAPMARGILGFGSSMLVTQSGDLLRSKSDEIVVGALVSVTAVTPYSLARRLAVLVQTLADQFIRMLLPLAAELDARNEAVRLRGLYIVGTRLTLAIALPTGVAIAALAGPVLTIWVGAEFARWAHVVVILVAAVLFDTVMWPPASVALGMGRHRRLAGMTVVSGVANIALSLALVGPLGLAGVAIGSLVPTIVECMAFVLPYTMSLAGVGWRDMGRDVLLPTLLPLAPTGVVLAVAARRLADDPSLVGVLVALATALLAYGIAYAMVNRRRAETEHLIALGRKVVRPRALR